MGTHTNLFDQCLGGRQCRFTSRNHKHSLIIRSPSQLKGKNISIPDPRLDQKLLSLGADVKRLDPAVKPKTLAGAAK